MSLKRGFAEAEEQEEDGEQEREQCNRETALGLCWQRSEGWGVQRGSAEGIF